MIVDVRTQLWDSPDQLGPGAASRLRAMRGQPWDRPDASPTAHDAAMEPVDYALIHGLMSQNLQAIIPAEQVARYVARNPAKYLGFVGLDPMQDGYLDQLDEALALGLVGVTISPASQDYHPTHTRAMALYERCAALKVPVAVLPGAIFYAGANLEFSQPHLLDEVARSFPELRLVIGQLGHPWTDQTLVMLAKHEHVFAELSDVVNRPWQLYNVLLLAYQQGVTGQLLLGSNFPFSSPEVAISTLYSVNTLAQGTHLPTIPREQLRSIVERDALECLGLAPPSEAPVSEPAAEPVEEEEPPAMRSGQRKAVSAAAPVSAAAAAPKAPRAPVPAEAPSSSALPAAPADAPGPDPATEPPAAEETEHADEAEAPAEDDGDEAVDDEKQRKDRGG